MNTINLQEQLADAQATIRALQNELAETNRGLVALSMELDERVQQRTAELARANQALSAEIVEHRRSELALAESEKRYRTLFEMMSEGFAIDEIICDEAGNPSDFLCIEVNPAFERHTGLKASDIQGRTVLELFPGAEPIWFERYGKVALTGEPAHFQAKFGPLGRWFEVSAYRAEPGRFATVFFDITERKEMEASLMAARDEAQHLARVKSAFLANMSHEIRTPLHVIIGLAHLLRRDISEPAQRERLNQLCASSEHLLALINDILDLSKIEAQRLALDHSNFSLDAVVDKVVRMVEVRAHEKGLTLTTDVAPRFRGMALMGDALRLTQVLINLCGNAVKFTERGAVRLSITCLAEDGQCVTLRISVDDSGIGIAPEDQAKLFQAFEQGDSSTAREHGGTGLGLAISQRLVALMGGTIRVTSRPGIGSTFSFDLVLPRAAVREADAATPASSAGTGDFFGRQILLVEDNPLGQEILFEMLTDIGCEVDAASDGAEALECARARRYDLILMDMRMPRMDGLAATRAIRALPWHRETPIIALTANAFAEDRQHCLDAGMNSHIAKPVTPDTLAAALGQWLPNLDVPGDKTPSCENELSRALAEIPWLDVNSTWRLSPDRLSEYCAQLDSFVKLHGQDMARLREHLAGGEYDAARVVAHNLQGIAGLTGARRIATLASGIVLALRAGADEASIMLLAADCEDELASLAEAVRALPELPTESRPT